MNKLLCIVGPTATGKTKLALYLSQLFPSILVSADSRQVYRGMDIVTGKDHPTGSDLIGIDLVDPSVPCSVSVWYDAVMPHITRAWGEGKLPIVVGGTGLYVRALTEGISTLHVPTNLMLRESLTTLSLPELQAKLRQLDPAKYVQMNHSDSNNPRRLIRAIEVALSPSSPLESNISTLESNIIGLQCINDKTYQSRIKERVVERIRLGAIMETKSLMSASSPQSFTAIGYRSLVDHLQDKLSYDQMIESWVHDELSYAKRQMTYFRKLARVQWYEAFALSPDMVASQVKAWYDNDT